MTKALIHVSLLTIFKRIIVEYVYIILFGQLLGVIFAIATEFVVSWLESFRCNSQLANIRLIVFVVRIRFMG